MSSTEKTTLVLLPGLNGTEGLFHPLMEKTPAIITTLAISYPTHEVMSYEALVPYVLAHLATIDGRIILVGESFSGPLSLLIAHQRPHNLIGIILVATFIRAPQFSVARLLPWQIGFYLTKPLYSLRTLLAAKHNRSMIGRIATELQKVSPKVLAARIQAIFAVDVRRELRECALPLLYCRGDYDIVVPEKNLLEIMAIKPTIEVAYFKTQHFLLQAAVDEVWEVIAGFVERITAEPGRSF